MPGIRREPRIFNGFVKGKPVPQGSMKAFRAGGKGKVVMIHSKGKELNEWRDNIAKTVKERMGERKPSDRAIGITVYFYLLKPKSAKRKSHTVKPDIDKLVRAVLDALTDVAYNDDAQVIEIQVQKCYTLTESNQGISLYVTEMSDEPMEIPPPMEIDCEEEEE